MGELCKIVGTILTVSVFIFAIVQFFNFQFLFGLGLVALTWLLGFITSCFSE